MWHKFGFGFSVFLFYFLFFCGWGVGFILCNDRIVKLGFYQTMYIYNLERKSEDAYLNYVYLSEYTCTVDVNINIFNFLKIYEY